jgi:predicted Fe-Mo cluster-binding NifX family protein
MKIAITTRGDTLDAPVEQRFARCTHVLFGEMEKMSEGRGVQAVPNPYAEESGGAGTRLADFIAARGAKVVLTGSPGRNTRRALDEAGVQTVIAGSGTAREALEALRAGKTGETDVAPPPEETGFGRGMGRGRGRGRGRGGGQGGGRGLGRGGGGGRRGSS